MKYNYPVKYATMPIYEQTGWDHGVNELERRYEVIGYIASKCYVISEGTKYFEDGSSKKRYEVVFPYKRYDEKSNDSWGRTHPDYNGNNQCTNSIVVDELYEKFDEAKVVAEELNKKVLQHGLSLLPATIDDYEKKLDDIMREHESKMKKYKKLEGIVEEKTSNMNTEHIPKQQSVIVMYDDKDRILPISLYDFIKMYTYESYYVCSVTDDEYNIMKDQITNEGYLDERCFDSFDSKYNKYGYLLANDIDKGIIRTSNQTSNKGSYYIKDNRFLEYDEDMLPFDKDPIFGRKASGIKVYTTEKLEDIIDAYKKYSNIENKMEDKSTKVLVKSNKN